MSAASPPRPPDRSSAESARPGAAPLSVAERRELQQRFEKAWRMIQDPATAWNDAHALLLECVTADPASALYVDALLLNLRRFDHSRKRFWLGRWSRQSQVVTAALRRDWPQVLRRGPEVLGDDPRQLPILLALIDASHAQGFRESAWRYAEECLRLDERNQDVWRRCGRVLASKGWFDQAGLFWRRLLASYPADDEATRILASLVGERPVPGSDEPAGIAIDSDDQTRIREAATSLEACLEQLHRWKDVRQWEAAELLSRRAIATFGQDLRLQELGEELILARHADQLETAERLARADDDPAWRALAVELRESLERLEVELLGTRSRRHPRDPELHARLAARLARQRNWTEAARCWEVATGAVDPAAAATAWLELGEAKQRLRQFPAALACYRRALEGSEGGRGGTEFRRRALGRLAALADGLGDRAAAESSRAQLARLPSPPESDRTLDSTSRQNAANSP